MMESTFGITGFNEGVNESLENKEINNSEGVVYNESDLERIEIAADIMGEIFTDEVISNWENLSVKERNAYLNEYYAQAGQALGIDTKGVYVADLYEIEGYGTQGVNRGDGYLGIDIRLVADPSQLGELLNTTTHEMRHQLQFDACRNHDTFPDIPQETLDQWEYEFTNYIDPSYDFEGYESQAVETDARAFAEEVVDDYLSEAGNDTYSLDIPLAKAIADPGDIEMSKAEAALEDIVSDDMNAVSEMKAKAEITETYKGPDDIGTVLKQGSSCGSGHGCMGSHWCSGY